MTDTDADRASDRLLQALLAAAAQRDEAGVRTLIQGQQPEVIWRVTFQLSLIVLAVAGADERDVAMLQGEAMRLALEPQ